MLNGLVYDIKHHFTHKYYGAPARNQNGLPDSNAARPVHATNETHIATTLSCALKFAHMDMNEPIVKVLFFVRIARPWPLSNLYRATQK